jgi:carbon monoxide dehydrogenase subunit G
MRIEGEHVFKGSKEQVWELVRDPSVLAGILPGTQELEQLSDTEYAGSINLRIGPVAGNFTGKIVVREERPPEHCVLDAEGEGSPGFFKGNGSVDLSDQGDGTTLMKYGGDVQIGGKLASVGQRLIDSTSKSMIRQGMQALDAALVARTSGEGSTEAEVVAPSEAEFAAAVAKDMAGEALGSRRWIWVVLAVVIVVIILALIWVNGAGGV